MDSERAEGISCAWTAPGRAEVEVEVEEKKGRGAEPGPRRSEVEVDGGAQAEVGVCEKSFLNTSAADLAVGLIEF
jgi:hypothetical protein